MTDTPAIPEVDYGDSKVGARFLGAVFPEGSYCVIRPTETWTESGKKRAKVDFKGIRHLAIQNSYELALRIILKRSIEMRTNTFFGVCPRFKSGGKHERAWQIRTVTTLWADIDHTTVDEVLERVQKASLPRPSAIVSSGNGVHVYWFLDKPYLIDDVGDPPPIKETWIEGDRGKKRKVEHFIDEHGDRHDLHDHKTGKPTNQNNPPLSAKATHIQDVVAGIAVAIGADHTFDLARLLRVPGSWNLKGKQNGVEPRRCELVELTDQRFSIDQFAEFAAKSPEKKRRDLAKTMPLPKPRKTSPAKQDKLNLRIAECAVSDDRSKADFSLCLFAIEKGIDPEDLWNQVSGVGKFEQRGRSYFDLTWSHAQEKARFKIFEKIESKSTSPKPITFTAEPPDGEEPSVDDGQSGTIVHNEQTMTVSSLFDQITHTLADSKEVFNRAGSVVLIRGDEITPLAEQASLAAALLSNRELVIEDSRGEEPIRSYVPLPAKYANPWLNDSRQRERLPPINLFTRHPVWHQTSLDWRISKPGYDADTGIYYAGPEIKPSDSTDHIDKLLAEFCWKSPADRTNYLGMLITIVLISRFITSKPGILLAGNQQGLGKTKLAQIISILRCGRTAPTLAYTDRDEELEKRLGSIVKSGVETIIVDNAKTKRGDEISSPILDRLITDNPVSFRLLGYSADIRAENSFIFALTANTPSISRDLITRTIPVNLYYEGDATARSFELGDPEGYAEEHRFEIIAELLGVVDRWIKAGCRLADIRTRFESRKWGATIGGILQEAGEPDFMSNINEAAEEMDPLRPEVHALIERMSGREFSLDWKASDLVRLAVDCDIFVDDLKGKGERAQATIMGKLLSRFIKTQFNVIGHGDVELEKRKLKDNNKGYGLVKIMENAAKTVDSRGHGGHGLFDVPQC